MTGVLITRRDDIQTHRHTQRGRPYEDRNWSEQRQAKKCRGLLRTPEAERDKEAFSP